MTVGHRDPDSTMTTRILLVEDDPSSQDLIRALCESRGEDVDVASDGFLGLRLLSERRHDVALIDYHLPEMDGYALARLMREIARPEGGRLALVGITADHHGLASRRGADTLFDAILVKPLEPAVLFETLDQLRRQEPAPVAAEADPADTLWRRRGLAQRPKALLCSKRSLREIEALSHAFVLVDAVEDAELILVVDQADVLRLRNLRSAGASGLLPAVALEAACGPACDLVFRVGDPDSWTALAKACRDFASRRARLRPDLHFPNDAASHLLALLVVADRGFVLGGDEPTYETGQSPTTRMAAVLSLAEEGKVVCEPRTNGVAVRLTEAGRQHAMPEGAADPETPVSVSESTRKRQSDAPLSRLRDGDRTSPVWRAPSISETASRISCADKAGVAPETCDTDDDALPVINLEKVQELRRLIGSEQISSLKKRLVEALENALGFESDIPELASQAHMLISMSGNLGFDQLAASCRHLQTAILQDEDVQQPLAMARHHRLRVIEMCAQSCIAPSSIGLRA